MSDNKHSLLQGMCICIILFCSLLTLQNVSQINRNEAKTNEIIKTLAAYAAGAADEEYDEIAKSIRHDLVLTEFSSDIEELAGQIPNTSGTCSLEKKELPADAYIACTNTGELYPLDLFSDGVYTESDSETGHISYGYDEISQSNIRIVKTPGRKKGSVTLYHGKSIVSIQRMKSVYCDDCIDKILNIIKNRNIKEFVIYDAKSQTFYGINDGAVFQIGEYAIEIAFKNGNYEIGLSYID